MGGVEVLLRRTATGARFGICREAMEMDTGGPAYFSSVKTTRRFFARPFDVLLEATGLAKP